MAVLSSGDLRLANCLEEKHHFPLGRERVALVGFSNRRDDSIGLFKVNPDARLLENVAARSVRREGILSPSSRRICQPAFIFT